MDPKPNRSSGRRTRSTQQERSQRAQIRRLRAQQQVQQEGEETWQRSGLPMWARTLIAVGVVLILILVFFRVNTIEVQGNVRYTQGEVADASGITLGDVLMGVNKTQAASRIIVKLPYVTQVEVAKVLPGTVRFTLVECRAAAAAESEFGAIWLMNADGKLLEELDNDAEIGYPLIQGTVLELPNAGDPVDFDDDERGSVAMETMLEVLDAGLVDQIQFIDVTDLEQITLNYGGRVEVQLGDITDVAYKIRYMQAAMAELGDSARGTLDLSFSTGQHGIFHPLEA